MTVEGFVAKITEFILSPLIGLLLAVALLVFFWGIFKFISNADNEEERRKGIQSMIWGVIGMFIMVSVAGIMAVIRNTLGV